MTKLLSFLASILFLTLTQARNENGRSKTDQVDFQKVGIGKVLVFGNSITKHGITPYWWGEWGMAATIRENDWVHKLESNLKTKNVNASVQGLNISDWERNHNGFDISQYDAYFSTDLDCVIFKIGENVTNLTNFDVNLKSFIDRVKTRSPQAHIVVVGSFWKLQDVENVLESVANQENCRFVSLTYMWDHNDIYQSTVDTQVFGDDNQWHTISDGGDVAAGVASHPNDFGMSEIANSIFNKLNELSTVDFIKRNIDIYPNPAKNTININSQDKVLSYEIYSLDGKKMISEQKENILQIDLSKLSTGNYILKLKTNSEEKNFKIIKSN